MLNKLFYLVESFKFRYYSQKITTAAELLLFISEHERQRHLAMHPGNANKSRFVPPDATVKSMKPYRETGTKVLFVGSLTIPTNMRGLQWYLTEIHPKLSLIQGYELVVAGHTNGESTEWLKKLSSHQTNITLRENVSDLEAIYESAAVFINPILRGAGLKVKTIRALQAGLPVVTTHVGSEGTGLQSGNHLLIAESPGVFAEHVRTLLSDRSLSRRLVSSAQAYLAAAFDQEKRMREAFASLLRSDTLESTVPNLHSEELVGS
jgi:glycosyltransferase involved in cell wall biosynthesis